MADETTAAVLRLEIDMLKERISELQMLHKTDTTMTGVLVREKHSAAAEAIARILIRLGEMDTTLALIYGDKQHPSDTGHLGRVQASLARVWDKINHATEERWKLRMRVAGISTGSTAATLGVLKLLGVI